MLKSLYFLAAVGLSIITVIADYFIKKASLENSVWNKFLFIGIVIYGLTGLGWVYVVKNIKLSTSGVIYGVSCIAILAIVSVFVFHEKITTWEIFGIILGISSVAVLYRFA